jgi:hypothetical protein
MYYKKIRSSQIYGALSHRVKDEDTSLLFRNFSMDENNHAKELKDLIESGKQNISIFFKIMIEMDSFWAGYFSYYLGKSFVSRFISKRELFFKNFTSSIIISSPNLEILNEIINSANDHLEIIKTI